MDNVLEYKGYIGSVNYSPTDEVFYGKIEAINALITFEATEAKQLRHEFEASVDDYLELCAEEGIAPEKTYKGIFNVRVGEALHRRAALAALSQGMKLNELVTKALSRYLEKSEPSELEVA